LGVIDLHAGQAGRLGFAAQPVFEALAGQMAAAIENARLAVEAEQSRNQAEALTRRQLHKGWEEFLNAIERRERIGFIYDSAQGLIAEPAETPQPDGGGNGGKNALETQIVVSGEMLGKFHLERGGDPKVIWSSEEAQLVNAIAERLGAHVETLRLLAQTERYRIEAEEAARRLTREGWEDYLNEQKAPNKGFTYDRNQIAPLAETTDQPHPNTPSIPDALSAVAIAQPIKVRDEAIGELTIDIPAEETTEAAALVNSVIERLSLHIESLRLLEETERGRQQLDRRAKEMETVARVSTAAATILEPTELLQAVTALSQSSFDLYQVHVYLLDPQIDLLRLAAGAGFGSENMRPEENIIPLFQEQSIIAQAARSRQPVIVNDIREEPLYLPHPLSPDTLSEMAIPMLVGDLLLGIFNVEASQVNRFTPDDVTIFSTLAAQVAIALRNAQLYAEQMATVERLRELDHLKSSFMANMSHELRTPLNSILGFTQVILEGLDGPLTDNMTTDLQLIDKNGRHLLNLINDVLDMAKIEAGRLSLSMEAFDLRELLTDVLETTGSLAREKSLYLRMEIDPADDLYIAADRFRLRQVLINLLGNSIKFTDIGGITIQVLRFTHSLQICVRDTGIGIPPDKLETVFEAFSQVDTSTTRKAGGTGLGLPISRRLVELHGGRLWAESRGISGEGSIFYLELPVDSANLIK
jgi:signal transduction histidine kinase